MRCTAVKEKVGRFEQWRAVAPSGPLDWLVAVCEGNGCWQAYASGVPVFPNRRYYTTRRVKELPAARCINDALDVVFGSIASHIIACDPLGGAMHFQTTNTALCGRAAPWGRATNTINQVTCPECTAQGAYLFNTHALWGKHA